MTVRECAIITAYTGIALLTGEKLKYFYQYLEELFKRPVYTHELLTEDFWNEIKTKSEKDFINLCKNSEISEVIND